MVVKPAISVFSQCRTAAIVRYASDSFSTWSFHVVSLYAWRSTCVWASMRPGRSVMPGRSMTRASGGAVTDEAGPTAAIRLPVTSTTQP